MKLVISGDPVEGFAYYGPFQSIGDAIVWAEENLEQWWIAPLQNPEEIE
ncbi:MAG: hypothetical protein VBE63_08390 [Lamprobacter sp.]|nr:hypothetical protein [Lamprobacter sp.]MEA3639948.1 hypothetical protein [Lamprobacter sp.]